MFNFQITTYPLAVTIKYHLVSFLSGYFKKFVLCQNCHYSFYVTFVIALFDIVIKYIKDHFNLAFARSNPFGVTRVQETPWTMPFDTMIIIIFGA